MGRNPRGSLASRPCETWRVAPARSDEPPRAGKSSRRRSRFGPDGRDEDDGRPEDGRPELGRSEPGREDVGRPDEEDEEGRQDGRPELGRPESRRGGL